MGMEFESFNGKGPVIESGYNTLNSTLTLRLDFDNQNSQTVGKKVLPGVVVGGNDNCSPANPLSGENIYPLNPPIPCCVLFL